MQAPSRITTPQFSLELDFAPNQEFKFLPPYKYTLASSNHSNLNLLPNPIIFKWEHNSDGNQAIEIEKLIIVEVASLNGQRLSHNSRYFKPNFNMGTSKAQI